MALSLVTRGYGIGSAALVVTRGYSPAAFVPSISVILTDAANAPIANLTGLLWAWWDVSTLNTQTSPAIKGSGASTNAAGVFSVTTLTGSALSAGGVGWLEVTNSDGTVSQAPVAKVAAGPIQVS